MAEKAGANRGRLVALALCAAISVSGAARVEPGPAGAERAPVAEGDWLTSAQRQIAEREYWASANAHGLQAPNRAHALRIYFGPEGIRVHQRDAAGDALLSLTLAGWGRPDRLAPVTEGKVASEGARVEIRRPGIVEWYENSPAGLEQGFTLAERPAGEGELVLDLSVAGANAAMRRDEVVLTTASGRRLAYGKLFTTDAAGRELPSRFEVPDAGRVRLAVNDASAAYPITIDPLLGAPSLIWSGVYNDFLGRDLAGAVDVNGDGYDDVIVSSRSGVFLFHGSASGIPGGRPDAADGRILGDSSGVVGWSVASAGDVNGDGYGDVVVGGTWGPEPAALVFLGGEGGIGDRGPANADAVLVSDRTNPLVFMEAVGAGDVNGDGFDDVLLGAIERETIVVPDELGEWTYDEYSSETLLFLGSASGIASGTWSMAAARQSSSHPYVYSYTRDLLGLSGGGDVNGDGYADVIVGTPRVHDYADHSGAVFILHGSEMGLESGFFDQVADTQLKYSDPAFSEEPYFGWSVSIAGDVDADGYDDVTVGAPFLGEDESSPTRSAIFVFHGGASGVASGTQEAAAARISGVEPRALMGWDVAGAGDVNADGYSDVILVSGDDQSPFVFFGGPAGVGHGSAATADVLLGADPSVRWASVVASAGDVNGDGFDEVIVGDPYASLESTWDGMARVLPEPGIAAALGAALALLLGLSRQRRNRSDG